MQHATRDRLHATRARTALLFEIVPPLNVTTPPPMQTTPPPATTQSIDMSKKTCASEVCSLACRNRTPSADTRPRTHRPDSQPRPAPHAPLLRCRISPRRRRARCPWPWRARRRRRRISAHECIAPPLSHHKARPKPNRAVHAARRTTHQTTERCGRAARRRCNTPRAPMQ